MHPRKALSVSKEPFLYFFNAQGDSIRLLRLKDSLMDQRLTALTVNKKGNIIVGGSKVPLDSPLTHRWYGNYWFAVFDNTGTVITEKLMPGDGYTFSYYPRPNTGITNIIPVSWDSIHYVVAINSHFPGLSGNVFWLDSTFTSVSRHLHIFESPPDVSMDGGTYITLTHFIHFEFNFIARKNHPYSFFWSFPVMMYYRDFPNYADSDDGLYFCRAYIKPFRAYDVYNLNWYKAFVLNDTLMPSYATFDWKVQDRSELAEAVNGDLLVQREVFRPSDTSANVFPSYNHAYHFPVLLRAGDTGHIKWGKSFQYIPSMDSGIYHNFYDISVAPDGRIVMGGYLHSHYPVPGYDTVGKVSWLVVLSDTLHDHQPQPTEPPDGIALTALGQQVKLLVYPNPTLNYTTLSLKAFNGNLNELTWQLCDINGRMLQSRKFNKRKTVINLNGLAAGAYFIKVWYQGKQVGAMKLLKE